MTPQSRAKGERTRNNGQGGSANATRNGQGSGGLRATLLPGTPVPASRSSPAWRGAGVVAWWRGGEWLHRCAPAATPTIMGWIMDGGWAVDTKRADARVVVADGACMRAHPMLPCHAMPCIPPSLGCRPAPLATALSHQVSIYRAPRAPFASGHAERTPATRWAGSKQAISRFGGFVCLLDRGHTVPAAAAGRPEYWMRAVFGRSMERQTFRFQLNTFSSRAVPSPSGRRDTQSNPGCTRNSEGVPCHAMPW